MYADDTTNILSHKSLATLYNIFKKELANVYNWFFANGLIINLNKTKYMLFNNSHSHINLPQLLLGNESLEKVNEFKFFGIIVQNNLQWTSQIHAISMKIACNTGILLSIKNCVPIETLTLLYNSFILSNIQYGIVIWGSTFDSHLNPIVTLQKKALRITTSSHPLAHSKPLALKLHSLLLTELYCYLVGIFMYNVYYKMLNQSITSLFSHTSNVHSPNTRSTVNCFFVPRVESSFLQRQLPYAGRIFWNNLPFNVRSQLCKQM